MKKIFTFLLILLFPLVIFSLDRNLIISESYSLISGLDFDLSFEDITIENIYGDELLLEIYSNNNHKIPKLNLSENVIYLKSAKSQKLYASDYCHIKIYIPYEHKLEKILISTNSGKIEFQNITSDETELKTFSGKIKGKKLSSSSYVLLKTDSGTIDIDSVASETVSSITNSGSTYILDLTTDYFDSTSVSGSIELGLRNSPKAYSIIKSNSGNVEISIQEKKGFDFVAFSTSGILKDEINNNRLSPRNTYQNSYFNGGAILEIHTTSGNITLK